MVYTPKDTTRCSVKYSKIYSETTTNAARGFTCVFGNFNFKACMCYFRPWEKVFLQIIIFNLHTPAGSELNLVNTKK